MSENPNPICPVCKHKCDVVTEPMQNVYHCTHCSWTFNTDSKWPRVGVHIPESEREKFTAWLADQTRPWIEGAEDQDQDGFYWHDYERWKQGLPIAD